MFVAKWEPGGVPTKPELTSAPIWLELGNVPFRSSMRKGLSILLALLESQSSYIQQLLTKQTWRWQRYLPSLILDNHFLKRLMSSLSQEKYKGSLYLVHGCHQCALIARRLGIVLDIVRVCQSLAKLALQLITQRRIAQGQRSLILK